MAAYPLIPLLAGLALGMYTMYKSRSRSDSLVHDPDEQLGILLKDKPTHYLSKTNRMIETAKNLNFDLQTIAPQLRPLKKEEKKAFTQHFTKALPHGL
jgi:hypothetical protein